MRLAIIPARGGSKRIPRKNIREFGGAPVISWSIRAALLTGLFDKVIVSTEDPEVASVAQRFGALVPFFRPLHLADDFTPTREVVNHAIETCESLWSQSVDQVCCIYATAPLIEAGDLESAHRQLDNGAAQFVFSAVAFEFPVQRGFRLNSARKPSMLQPEHRFTRSQDLEPIYHDAAQFYWGHRDAFMRGDYMFSENSEAFILPPHRVRDLDTEEDWLIAQAMWNSRNTISQDAR